MKSMMTTRPANVIVGVLLLCLCGCGKSSGPSQSVIGVLIPTEYAGWSQAILHAAEQATHGDNKVVLKTAPTDEMERALKALSQTRINGAEVGVLVILAEPRQTISKLVRTTRMGGQPVILFHHDLFDSGRDLFVGGDNARAGQLLGEYVVKDKGLRQTVVIITDGLVSVLQQQRFMSLRTELSKSPGTTIIDMDTIYYENDKQLARDLKDLLTRMPGLHAIASTGGWIFRPTVLPVLETFKGKVYAIDATPAAFDAVKQGYCTVLVAPNLYEQALTAIQLAAGKLKQREKYNPVAPSPIPPVVVTRENYSEYEKKWGGEITSMPSSTSTKPAGQ